MKDDRIKIFVPKEPYQIGQTSTGEPIWIDPKDSIQTPDEKLEQKQNMVDSRFDGNVEKIADVVIENAQNFLFETVIKTIPKSLVELLESDSKSFFKWFKKSDYHVIQDGLTTVVKHNGKILRSMTADVDVRFREAVIARVMQKALQPA